LTTKGEVNLPSIGNIPLLRRNDIILASFPRSGNTWIMNILLSLGILALEGYFHDLHIERAIDIPDEPSEYIPALKLLKSISGNKVAPYRVIKTHNRFQPEFHKSIYLIRDGRDVMVSYYYYYKRFNSFEGSFLDFLNISPSPALEWAEHAESWIAAQEAEIFFMGYENLKEKTLKEIQALLNFMHEARTSSEIQEAITNCSFQRLSNHEMNAKPPLTPDRNSRFFRKGVVGDWKRFFESEHILKFKQEANWMMLKLGYVKSPDWS
jgi:estrone sulfotransferase